MEPEMSRSQQSENEMKMKDWRPPTAMLLAVLSTLLFGAGLPAAGAEGNPMIVGGFQVGERMQSILDQISGALDTVKDVDTAKEADATFAEAERRIVELEPFLLFLPHQGKTAIAAQVTGALIGMKPTADKLLADPEVGPVLKPGFDKLVDKFKALGS
jgi:hypothetical protein